MLFLGFLLTYKGSSGQWHETRLPASRQSFVLENLQCGTSYQIMLTALNSVGHGEPSEIQQITTNGRATVPPLSSVRSPHFFEDPTILVPIVCAVVVLVVIISVTAFVVVWKRRDPSGEAPSDICSPVAAVITFIHKVLVPYTSEAAAIIGSDDD
ncbi:down syndrome cell adhesion molecule-like protein Dscam2 [Trichonephila inaurata madagascariensis]|uniref:Down syndrome cell adhesion molecule-like protein Dscam2 n=1 Tax=Trichonephila inaurata madagascariensis TaxID=2747483 RepID=A0A8X6YE51_9ARAC|nr:down syndrome cell adhesion molecule-like protein Dscam2 [Trichonephila inaurata madagascariensis]